MCEDKSKLILRLCDEWKNATMQSNGGIAIGLQTEKYRLARNGIFPHELNFNEIQSACVGLTKVLLLKGHNTVIDFDHIYFWSWIGEVFLSPISKFFSKDEFEIKELFDTVIRASLAGVKRPPKDEKEWQMQTKLHESFDHNARQLINHSHLIIAYLSFPLLEAMLKRACKRYVDYSGNVIRAFSVPAKGGGTNNYVSCGRGKKRCNSIRDLLYLYYNQVANISTKNSIDEIRKHLSSLENDDAFDIIQNWRNASLHGETNFPTIGGTVLNIAILIALGEVEETYDKNKEEILKHVKWESQNKVRSPWSYYPPY